jgi:hypothetical protein
MGFFRAAARLIAPPAFGFALATTTATARAEAPPSTELAWSAPDGCPGEASVRAEIEGLLGQTLDARRDQKLRITGDVRGDARSGFNVALRVTSARGAQRRELSNPDCHKLSEAAALVVALAIDPKLVVPPPAAPAAAPPTIVAPASSSAPPPSTPSPSTPLRDETPAPSAKPGAPSAWRLSALALGLASGGALPGVAFGAGARLTAGMGRFGLVAHGAYFFPKVEPVQGTSSSGIRLDLGRAGVGFCGVPLTGNPSLMACLGPVFGDMSGEGTKLENASTEHDLWTAVLAELTLTHLTSFGLTTFVGLEGGPVVDAPRFGITENGSPVEVYRASSWVFSGSLGVGFSN